MSKEEDSVPIRSERLNLAIDHGKLTRNFPLRHISALATLLATKATYLRYLTYGVSAAQSGHIVSGNLVCTFPLNVNRSSII